MNTKTLLIELGTEELPPKLLKGLGNSFKKSILDALHAAELSNTKECKLFAAPRRLAIVVDNVLTQQPNQSIERRGPAVHAAFKEDGSASPAALGFAKSCGVEIEQLDRLKTDKGEWLYFKQDVPGQNIAQLIQNILDQAIKQLPIAKRMRWGDSDAEFVRPVHWLVALHDDTLLPANILELQSNNQSRGHRFHGEKELQIVNATDYESELENKGYVIVDFDRRQHMIKQQIEALAASINGTIEEDQALLDEVTGLVEYPHALLGSIDQRFMDVPQESLISSMRDHQKYFHIVDANNALMPYFITVSNIDSKDPERVKSGNERVLRARLSDAEFFWQTDQKTSLENRLPALENVLYHIKLGSVANKAKRLEKLAANIAEKISADSNIAGRGGKLAKADLVSNMVGEFSDLQGIMGRYYAINDNETSLVGECIEQHYWPKKSGGQLPISNEAQAVSLAEKLDTLVGIYGIGEIPTGDKDPYALRRAALGILRILIEKQHALSLSELIEFAANGYAEQNISIDSDVQKSIVEFIQERFKSFYQTEGIATTHINSVLACRPEKPLDFDARVRAIKGFTQLPEATELSAANKRISNILKKTDASSLGEVETTLLQDDAEKQLSESIDRIEKECLSLFSSGDYESGLKLLATLRDSVDGFFDNVMVMADDITLRNNRLSLLKRLQDLFLRVADISIL